MTDKEKSINQDKTRAKDWTFIVYPESAPADWRGILADKLQVKAIISPLHDKDVLDDVEQTPKKAHYHVILRFDSKKSFAQIKEITDLLNQPIPQKIKSIEGAVRYLIHADSPDKAQYNQADIQVIGNIDLDRYFKKTAIQKDELTAEIMDYICDNDITELADLLDYCRCENIEWFRHLCSNAYLIDKYITSRRNKKEQNTSSKSIVKALSMLLYGEVK
ncbi:replication protein [uncultured Streptococcus sp.]|uniref:replication protein n=1 Tax=uncultured Streptococcus sp. TaxID=83427 RepID=UPI0025D3B097|nr:replication protein [uncultured Streptococcus sp.]